jgi:hypothetical protein
LETRVLGIGYERKKSAKKNFVQEVLPKQASSRMAQKKKLFFFNLVFGVMKYFVYLFLANRKKICNITPHIKKNITFAT